MGGYFIHDFEAAGQAVLAFLQRRYGFGLWMVTRTDGDRWVVLQTEDHGYGIKPGTELRWADSFCSEMVKGHGPRIAPDSTLVPAYAAARIGHQITIKAYVGVPLYGENDELFGTLCAIDSVPHSASINQDLDLIELLAALLSTVLAEELRTARETRRSERLALESEADAMTGLINRRGWDRLLAVQDECCRRYGDAVSVLSVDIDGLKAVNDTNGHTAGDALIVRTAAALREAAREIDVVARLGGDEFGILAIGCDQAGAEALAARTRLILSESAVQASVGVATRTAALGLQDAWDRADQAMYAEKRARLEHGPKDAACGAPQ